MLKKLCCNHNYEWYHTERDYSIILGAYMEKYLFLCKKCGKTSSLYESDIRASWKACKRKAAREEALGKAHMNETEFQLQTGTGSYNLYSGRAGYYMSQRYKRYIKEASR